MEYTYDKFYDVNILQKVALHNKVDNNTFIIKLYGITQDPESKNYMMVLEYAESGSLRDFLKENNKLDLKIKINYLYNIASGLENIHGNEIIHRDLLYGVLPYIAPEILRGQSYTKASDIYTTKICLGLRPRFNTIKVPQLIVHLIKRCLDAHSLNRPTALKLEINYGNLSMTTLQKLVYLKNMSKYDRHITFVFLLSLL
ncbi:unnamed protein product [Rhizophagus irregularis]|nr:unnamed protein product [Rhizophagus irregularis]